MCDYNIFFTIYFKYYFQLTIFFPRKYAIYNTLNLSPPTDKKFIFRESNINVMYTFDVLEELHLIHTLWNITGFVPVRENLENLVKTLLLLPGQGKVREKVWDCFSSLYENCKHMIIIHDFMWENLGLWMFFALYLPIVCFLSHPNDSLNND